MRPSETNMRFVVFAVPENKLPDAASAAIDQTTLVAVRNGLVVVPDWPAIGFKAVDSDGYVYDTSEEMLEEHGGAEPMEWEWFNFARQIRYVPRECILWNALHHGTGMGFNDIEARWYLAQLFALEEAKP